MTNAEILKLKTDTTSLYQITVEYSNGEYGPLLSTDSEFTRIWSWYGEIRKRLIDLDKDIFSSLRDITQPEPDINEPFGLSASYSGNALLPLINELKTAIQYLDIYEKKLGSSRQIDSIKVSAKSKNPKKLFVVHGRNEDARKALFDFLRSLELNPLEWTEAIALTKKGTPYVGEILDEAFLEAQAVIVLFTGDDLARLGTRFLAKDKTEEELTPQPRPNVLFEAGMAFGTHPERTILVQIGKIRGISDIAGRYIIHLNNSPQKRQELISRLKTAGCDFDPAHKMDWLKSGDFEKCVHDPDFKRKARKGTLKKVIIGRPNDFQTKIQLSLAKWGESGFDEMDEGSIATKIGTSIQELRKHLKILEEKELVTISRIEGTDIFYKLTPKAKTLIKK